MKTIKGEPVYSFRVFKQGNYWKWIINTANNQYESGNFETQKQAFQDVYEQFQEELTL